MWQHVFSDGGPKRFRPPGEGFQRAHVLREPLDDIEVHGLRRDQRCEVGLAGRSMAKLVSYRIERRKRHRRRGRNFNTDGLSFARVIDHQTRLHTPGPHALLAGLPGQVVVRGNGLAVSECDLEVGFSHDSSAAHLRLFMFCIAAYVLHCGRW